MGSDWDPDGLRVLHPKHQRPPPFEELRLYSSPNSPPARLFQFAHLSHAPQIPTVIGFPLIYRLLAHDSGDLADKRSLYFCTISDPLLTIITP